jgi:hypothetical protein
MCWEIDNFVIKSDIFRLFFICKNILKKLSCYHDNNFKYFMFGKYNGFVSKARVSACMYFLVGSHKVGSHKHSSLHSRDMNLVSLDIRNFSKPVHHISIKKH